MYDGVGAFGGAWSLLFVVMYFFVKVICLGEGGLDVGVSGRWGVDGRVGLLSSEDK